MKVTITPRNVMAVILEVDTMLREKKLPFNQAEIMIGLQELVGRIIVDMSGTQVGADILAKHCKQHLDDTLRVGMQSKNRIIVPS